MDDPTLFDDLADAALLLVPVPPPPSPPKVSPDVRRRQRQAETLTHGYHPLGLDRAPHLRLKLHDFAAPADDRDAPGRRCGNCLWRQAGRWHTRSYPKCMYPEGRSADDYERHGPPRASHGAATDCRAWWPGCTDHQYGDPKLSPDAARHVPDEAVP